MVLKVYAACTTLHPVATILVANTIRIIHRGPLGSVEFQSMNTGTTTSRISAIISAGKVDFRVVMGHVRGARHLLQSLNMVKGNQIGQSSTQVLSFPHLQFFCTNNTSHAKENHPIIPRTNFLVLLGGRSRKMVQATLMRAALHDLLRQALGIGQGMTGHTK